MPKKIKVERDDRLQTKGKKHRKVGAVISTRQRSWKNSESRDLQTRYSFPFTMVEGAPNASKDL